MSLWAASPGGRDKPAAYGYAAFDLIGQPSLRAGEDWWPKKMAHNYDSTREGGDFTVFSATMGSNAANEALGL